MSGSPVNSPQVKVAAIFATMNRAATAVACVKALAMQTCPPALVIVSDNTSTDDTVPALRSLENLPFTLIVSPLAENGGNAGGVHHAIEEAFNHDMDAVWILDDDSWPRPDALAELLPGYSPRVVRHSLQINPTTQRFTWPLPVITCAESKTTRLVWTEEELGQKSFFPTLAAWTGALVSREIYTATGPVNTALFIRGEDEEYPWRISLHGYTFELARRSVLDHPGPSELIHWQFLGKHLFLEKDLPAWKLYYKVRNMVWLKHQQSGRAKSLAMIAAYLVGIFWTDGFGHFHILRKAVTDGWKGHLGKLDV